MIHSAQAGNQAGQGQGIVVVAHEASNIADDVDYDIEAFQNTDFGEAFCKPLAEGMGGKGKLAAVVGSKTMETHMAWYNSCKSMLEKRLSGHHIRLGRAI